MKTDARKTWLEKQSDEVQVFVLSMEDEGVSYEEQALAVRKRFEIRVTATSLCNSLARARAAFEKEFLESKVMGREIVRLLQRHPSIDPEVLIRGYFMTELASPRFRTGGIKPKDLLAAVHQEQKLRLDGRRVRALEEHNRLKAESLSLAERRVILLERRQAQLREGIEGVLADEEAGTEETLRKIREVYGLFDQPSAAEASDGEPSTASASGGRPPKRDSAPVLPGEVGA